MSTSMFALFIWHIYYIIWYTHYMVHSEQLKKYSEGRNTTNRFVGGFVPQVTAQMQQIQRGEEISISVIAEPSIKADTKAKVISGNPQQVTTR